jgi:hypothetical protein
LFSGGRAKRHRLQAISKRRCRYINTAAFVPAGSGYA